VGVQLCPWWLMKICKEKFSSFTYLCCILNGRTLFSFVRNGWLIDYLQFYVPLKNFSLIWSRHHCRWRAANFGLCSALRAFEQGGIFIVSHLLWHGAAVFRVSSEGPRPIQLPLTTHGGMWRIYSNPDPHGSCEMVKYFLRYCVFLFL
jgi:hypothetical protein